MNDRPWIATVTLNPDTSTAIHKPVNGILLRGGCRTMPDLIAIMRDTRTIPVCTRYNANLPLNFSTFFNGFRHISAHFVTDEFIRFGRRGMLFPPFPEFSRGWRLIHTDTGYKCQIG